MKKRPIHLRVLMSADTVGGVWVYALQLAVALRHHGVQVVLATMGAPLSPQQRCQAGQIPDLVVCESRFRLEWMDSPWEDVAQAGRWLLQLEQRYCPDLVHLNHYTHGHLDWRAPRLVVGHSCVLSWWRAVFSEEPPIDYELYRCRVRAGLQGADLVAAPSRAMLSALQYHYGPLPSATVVYNGRGHLGSARVKKAPFILAVGRAWDAAKNLEALAAAAPSLRWPVYLAGEVKHPEGGRAELGQLRILGQLAPEVIADWYGRAGIYALPARYEPFGLSVLEASLAGCAPVLGDIDSLRELWDGAACFVPVDDPQALRNAVNQLIDDPVRRKAIASRAAARARRYTLARMAAHYLALYRGLVEGGAFSEARAVADFPWGQACR